MDEKMEGARMVEESGRFFFLYLLYFLTILYDFTYNFYSFETLEITINGRS